MNRKKKNIIKIAFFLCILIIILGAGCKNSTLPEHKTQEVSDAINLYNTKQDIYFASFNDMVMTINDNVVLPHVLGNGETAYYLNNEGLFNPLCTGDSVNITIESDCDYFSSKGNIELGYACSNNINVIEKIKLHEKTKLSFDVSKDGKYAFYIKCISSDPIIIKSLSFEFIKGE